MAFTVATIFIFSIMFAVAAALQFCLLRMDQFRKTQQDDFPALCKLVNSVFKTLHLAEIFGLDGLSDYEEDDEEQFVHHPTPETIDHLPCWKSPLRHRAA